MDALMPELDKIDVGPQMQEIERDLRCGERRVEALAILQRWQFDDMLDDASREKARRLVQEFAVEIANQRTPYSLSDLVERSDQREWPTTSALATAPRRTPPSDR